MANHNKRLLRVILGATLWCLGVVWSLRAVWVMFNRDARNAPAQTTNAFPLIVVCFCVVSISAFCYLAKRMPRFAVGLAFLAAYLFLLAVYTVASLVLKIDNIWVDGLNYLLLVLLPVSTFILAWQGAKKTKDHKEREGKTERG